MSGRTPTDLLSSSARDIAAQPDGPAALVRAVDLAAEVVCCSLVDVVRVRTPGGLGVVGSTEPDRSRRLVQTSEAAVEHPASFCSVAGSAVVIDLTGDARWPGYALDVHRATGLGSEMDIGIHVAEGGPLVLRFFSERTDAWSEDDRRDAIAFAELAALAIDSAELRHSNRNLTNALASNRLIGAATGILMAQRRLTYQGAFGLLLHASQHSNRKLRNLADDVVLTGDLPSGDERFCGCAASVHEGDGSR